MSDLNHKPNDNPASWDPDPEGVYKEYSGPTQAEETAKTETHASPR